MKKIILLIFACSIFASCTEEEQEVVRNNTSIIPTTELGRTNKVLGTVKLASRNVEISVWDHGQIDGDIVSIYVNGRKIIARRTLDGPGNKIVANTTLEYNGYNYILLYAHNEGRLPPNTATFSIDDGVSPRKFSIESNLSTNGTVNLVVD